MGGREGMLEGDGIRRTPHNPSRTETLAGNFALRDMQPESLAQTAKSYFFPQKNAPANNRLLSAGRTVIRSGMNKPLTLSLRLPALLMCVVCLPSCDRQLRRALEESRQGTAQIYVQRLVGDLAMYELTNKLPPSTAQGLKALVEKPTGEPVPSRWKQSVEKLEPDPWGAAYRYEYPGRHNTHQKCRQSQ